jgi:uncharacterized protein (DUF427 family)
LAYPTKTKMNNSKVETMKAIWNDQVIAESDNTVVIEGNHYFPPESIKKEFFKSSDFHSTCPWKGQASYYSLEVNGKENADAAWYYKNPSELAKGIKDHVAFWKGVEVIES